MSAILYLTIIVELPNKLEVENGGERALMEDIDAAAG